MINNKSAAGRVYWEDLATIILLPVVIYLSSHVWTYPLVRRVSGFAFLLMAPGYSLLALIFPKPREMDLTSQLGLSMGVSIALTTIFGLILNYTLVGINSTSVLIAETIFVVVCSAVALWRRKTIYEENMSEASSEAYFIIRKLPWALALYIVAMVIFSVGGIAPNQAHTTVVSDTQEHFTEFFIIEIDPQEDASQDIYLKGEPILFTVTAINRECVDATYRVVVSGDEGEEQTFDFELKSGEAWRQVVVVVHNREHQNAKILFTLYKQGISTTYRSLYIWTTIEPRQ